MTMFTIIWLNLLIYAVSSKEIVVSGRSRGNTQKCGTPQEPCKTLENAIWRSRKDDVIVLTCPHQNRRYCQFNIYNAVTVYHSVNIKSDENNKYIAQIYLKKPEQFKMKYVDTKMTFLNVTMHLTWAFGNAMKENQAIVFEHCRLILSKRKYIIGVGKILQFVIGSVVDLKLKFKNSVVEHTSDNPQNILLLLLSDSDGGKIDISIINTIFLGHIKIQMSSDQNRALFIDGAEIINGTMAVEGRSKEESWESVEIRNTVFQTGIFPELLSLSKLPLANLYNVSFFGEPNVNLLQTFLCGNIFLETATFYKGNVEINSGKTVEIKDVMFTQSNVILRSYDKANMVKISTNYSKMNFNEIRSQTIKDSVLHKCSMEMFKIDILDADNVYFMSSLDEYTMNIVNCSKGMIFNSFVSGKSVRIAASNMNIETCRFEKTYGENGGAIYNDGSDINVTNVKFEDNSAMYHGGAIYNRGTRSLRFTDSQFISSTSEADDPALLGNVIYSEAPIVLEEVFFDLKSSTNSPAIYIKTKAKDLLGCNDVVTVLGEFTLKCPFNHEMKTHFYKSPISETCLGTTYEFFTITCSQCSKGTYNTAIATMKINGHENNLNQESDLKCKKCPPIEDEVIIIKSIQSKEEALNSSTSQQQTENPKLLADTCPQKKTKTIYIVDKPVPVIQPKNPCPNNRTGPFCRICREGYSTSLFTEKCVNKKEEKDYPSTVFWISYLVLAVFYTGILMYIKELVVLLNIKGMYLEIKKFFKVVFVSYDADDFFYDDNQIHNIPDVINEEFDMVEVNHQQIEMTYLNFNMGTVTAVIKIVFFFYQVETLFRTTSPSKLDKEIFVYSILRDTISSLLSLRIAFSVDRHVSIPKENLNEIEKEFIKDSGMILLLTPIVVIITFYLLTICCRKFTAKKGKSEITESPKEDRESRPKQRYDELGNGGNVQTTALLSGTEIENPIYQPQPPPQQSEQSKDVEAVQTEPVPSPPPRPIRSTIKEYFSRIDGKVPIYVWMPLSYRVQCFVLLIMVLGYLPISVFLLRSIYCISNGKQYLLVMQPTVTCFNVFHVIAFGLVSLWVIPFPAALYILSKMQYTCKIVPREFLTALFFPPILLYYFFRNRLCTQRRYCGIKDAMLAKHLLMIIYECFRLQKNDRRYDVMWEVMFVLRKLLMVIIAVCSPDPTRLYLTLIFLVLFLLHHIKMKPFSNPTMNGLESISLSLLCILCAVNIFWTHQIITNEMTLYDHVTQLVLLHIEYIILCFPIILIVLFLLVALICFVCNKTCFRNR